MSDHVNLIPIYIIKLGGSILTDKTQENTLQPKIIENITKEIIEFHQTQSNIRLILVHGAGSFGHPLAKKFELAKGINNRVPDQIYALTQTHNNVMDLNHFLLQSFEYYKIPILSVAPSSIFIQKNEELVFNGGDLLQSLLAMEIMPLLFGDILFHSPPNFSILSGDRIISILCRFFHDSPQTQYKVIKVIFCFDKDGILFQNRTKNPTIIDRISSQDLDKIDTEKMNRSMDVTGGLRGKFAEIKTLSSLGIPTILLNGSKSGYLLKFLLDQEIPHTLVI